MKLEPLGPDLIVHNGKVITVDGSFTIADSVAVKGDRIVGVGGGPAMLAVAGAHTRIIDLAGHAVVPGLFDGHAHLDREGLKEVYPSLAGARSIDDILQIIEGLVAAATPGDWVVTMPIGGPPSYIGDPKDLAEGRFPTRHDLDRVSPDNPVYIRPIWGYWRHDEVEPLISVANTRALEIAGVTRHTPAPCATVVIDKDPATGEPTGIFLEDTLAPIVELTLMRPMGDFTLEDRVWGLERSIQVYQSFGTTSVFEGHGMAAELIEAYKELSARGGMTMRADLPLSASWNSVAGVDPAALFGTWAGWLAGRGLGDSHLRVSGLFALASAEEGSVLNIEDQLRGQVTPYTGWASRYYDHALPRDQLIEAMVAAARHDIRIATITIPMLEIMEEANRIEPIIDKRWVIGHVDVLTQEQINRIRDLGLATTIDINRAIYRIGSRLRTQFGPQRENDIMPLRRMHEAGNHFSLSSDNNPVSLFFPYWQAVGRIDQVTGDVIAPEEKISREDALRAATIDGAYLCMSENDRGSIEVGKLADFAVLSADLLTAPEDEIKDIAADLTVIGGRVVFERDESGSPAS